MENEIQVVNCRGRDCEETSPLGEGFSRSEVLKYHEWARSDYHGIFTGHYCDDCYENNYPYRKDRYPTMEADGHGDYLEDDY